MRRNRTRFVDHLLIRLTWWLVVAIVFVLVRHLIDDTLTVNWR